MPELPVRGHGGTEDSVGLWILKGSRGVHPAMVAPRHTSVSSFRCPIGTGERRGHRTRPAPEGDFRGFCGRMILRPGDFSPRTPSGWQGGAIYMRMRGIIQSSSRIRLACAIETNVRKETPVNQMSATRISFERRGSLAMAPVAEMKSPKRVSSCRDR